MHLYNRMLNSAVVIASETTLALYPILIKKVPTDISTQILSRILTYSILGFALASSKDIKTTWATCPGLKRSLRLGLITLLHIATSYFAFSKLPAGIAMSLFYTYPIFNLLGGVLGFGESISPFQIVCVALAFLGVVLVSTASKDTDEKKNPYDLLAIAAGLAAAATETLMYFAVRTAEQPNPFFATLELYPGAFAPFVAWLLYQKQPIDLRSSVWLPMILFNSVVGFLGYNLRFWAIPRISTLLFSVLSFIGVIASFGWGYLFAEEVPSWTAVLGGTLIAASVGASGAAS